MPRLGTVEQLIHAIADPARLDKLNGACQRVNGDRWHVEKRAAVSLRACSFP